MVIKRKMFLMRLYSALVKNKNYNSAKEVLHFLIGLNRSKWVVQTIRFWSSCYGFDFKEFYSND